MQQTNSLENNHQFFWLKLNFMLRGLLGQLTDQMFLPKANKTLIGLINLHITMRVHIFFAGIKRHEMKHKKCKTSICYMSILDIVRSCYIVFVWSYNKDLLFIYRKSL